MLRTVNFIQTYNSMRIFLDMYYEQTKSEDIVPLLNHLKSASRSEHDPVWQQWLIAIEHAINDTYKFEDFYQ